MNFIETIKEKARNNIKKIVLPETMDLRVLEAAEECSKDNLAEIVLIGKKEEVEELATSNNIDLSKTTLIDPFTNESTEKLVNDLYELRKEKGMTLEGAREALTTDYMYYACMLVHEDLADGVVSGACHSTANTMRPALQIIKTAPGAKIVSTFFLMVVPDCDMGANGTFVFSDCGLEQNPDSEKLAAIAGSSCESFVSLTGGEPLAAMLSHSTMGSAKHADVDKVVEAVKIAKELYPQYKIDGEMQLDAAIVPSVAASKAPNSEVAGKANVLIFPDLDAGNIGYKLVQRLAKAEAYGPITQGIRKPINDLSRGCSKDDIVGLVAITAVQAQK
jgi:phosphate acetyltransferase